MLEVLQKVFSFLKGLRVSVGRDPAALPAGHVILFPLQPETLCCGLAGILTVNKRASKKTPDHEKRMSRAFSRVREGTLDHVLSKRIRTSRYLGGSESLRELEQITYTLKQPVPYRQLFSSVPETAALFDLARQMAELLRREESTVEEQANAFSTEDMEIINSRLILLKDILWSLEKDILSNLEKIEKLSGQDHREEVSPVAFEKYRKINYLLNALDRLEVRGRDSAGIQLSFTLKKKEDLERVLAELRAKNLYDDFTRRTDGGDLLNGSIHRGSASPNGEVCLSFT
jgi:glucosamine--fructose-6-phosphate aminotransferase (isomerizing)